jgi:hypothetical protein
MSYASRIASFNQSVTDAKEHADAIAEQVENLKGINRDPTKNLYNKINDSIGAVSGTIGQAAQLYHTYKHGQVMTFLEKHDINTALGRNGQGGLKNAGNELLNTVDQARNAPRAGLAPNSESIQLPEAKQLVSSLKGRIIGNESQGASPSDLGQLVGRTKALPDKADDIGQDAVNRVLNSQAPAKELSNPTTAPKVEDDNPFGFFKMFPEEQSPSAAQTTGTAIKEGSQGTKLYTPEGLDPARAGASNVKDDARESLARQFTQEDETNPVQNQLLREASDKLQPISSDLPETNTNLISGGTKVVNNLAKATNIEGDVDNAVNVAGNMAKAAGSAVGRLAGEGGGELLTNTIATGMEAVAPETGPLAPLVAAVGGLVALGSSIAGMFHKNKPPPKVVAPPPPAQAQVGADLSVSK